MRTSPIEIRLTIPFPIDKPDLNGTIYSREAVEKSLTSIKSGLPIIFRDNDKCPDGAVIGMTSEKTYDITFDNSSQTLKVTIAGVVWYGGMDISVDEINERTVSSFEINSIGLSR